MKQTKKLPLISVIIPVHNAARYLSRALESIQKQTYTRLQIICIDDISTDESFDILKKFSKKDTRFTVLQLKKHSGASTAANFGLQYAKGQYIARMDADDISLPRRLEKQLHYLQNNPSVIGVGCQCIRIDEHGKKTGIKTFPLNHNDIRSMIFRSMPLQQPTLMVNRNMLPKSFLWYDKNLHIVEDYDLFYRLMNLGKLANLSEYLLQYREHPNGQTFRSPKKTFWLIWKTRIIALTTYGYTPDIFSIATVAVQTIIALILPERLLYPLHIATRSLFIRKQ